MIAIAKKKKTDSPLQIVGGKVYARTIAGLVSELGITNTTYQDWRMQGCPDRESNGYPVGKIFRWYRERQLEKMFGTVEDEEQKSLQARLELAEVLKAEHDAALKAIKLAEAEGRLIDKETALAEIEEIFHRVRARLEQIPQEVGTTIPPEIRADLIADMRHKIQLVLREMEAWGD